jgi:hypothetical protein
VLSIHPLTVGQDVGHNKKRRVERKREEEVGGGGGKGNQIGNDGGRARG